MTQDLTTTDLPAAAERAIAAMHESHGAAFAAAALASQLGGHEIGDEGAISRTIGGYLFEVSNVIRHATIESASGITSSAMQELAAHLEASAQCLISGLGVARVHDREMFLAALCNAEALGNSACSLAGLHKVEADTRLAASNLRQAFTREPSGVDLSDLV